MGVNASKFNYSAAIAAFKGKLRSLDKDNDGKISFEEAQGNGFVFNLFNSYKSSGSAIDLEEFAGLFSKLIANTAPENMSKIGCFAKVVQNGISKNSKSESNFFSNLQTNPFSHSEKPMINYDA